MPWKLSAVLFFALACLPLAPLAAEPETEEPAPAAEPEPEPEPEAEEAPAYDRDGWYAGLGGGYAFETFENGNAGDSGFAQLRAGYHFLRFAAVEAELEYSPRFGEGSGRYDDVRTATWAVWLNVKGYPTAPWTGCVQPYVMASVAWMWERRTGQAINGADEDGGFAARFGGGIDFYVTRQIVVTVESAWVLPTGSLNALRQVQLGGAVQYRF